MPLTPKQTCFVEQYLIDLNGTQAAIRAGYSPNGADVQAVQLLRNPRVRAELDRQMAERASRVGVTQDRVLRELVRLGFGDARKVLRWTEKGVRLIPSDELDDDAAALVAEVAETKDGLRIKVHDKLKALNLMGQHLGMWKTVQDVNLAGGVTVKIEGDDAAL